MLVQPEQVKKLPSSSKPLHPFFIKADRPKNLSGETSIATSAISSETLNVFQNQQVQQTNPVKSDITSSCEGSLSKSLHPFFRKREEKIPTETKPTLLSSIASVENDSQTKPLAAEVTSLSTIALSMPIHAFFSNKNGTKPINEQVSSLIAAADSSISIDPSSNQQNQTNLSEEKPISHVKIGSSKPLHPFFNKRDIPIDTPSGLKPISPFFVASQKYSEAPWPRPFECQISPTEFSPLWRSCCSMTPLKKRKLKGASGKQAPGDSFINSFSKLLHHESSKIPNTSNIKIMSMDEVLGLAEKLLQGQLHLATARLIDSLKIPETYSRYPFRSVDQELWTFKYRPRVSEEILGNEAVVADLREWLQEMKLPPTMRKQSTSNNSSPAKTKPKSKVKKKRKVTHINDLDDFIVDDFDDIDSNGHKPRFLFEDSTDDESFSLNNTNCRKRTPVVSNVIPNLTILAGPPGSAKTACVYACAEELGYKVFEIYSGMKRSGKDINAAVGDVAQNHLVKSNLKTSIMMGNKNDDQIETKQSLILIDDVDICYEEDKNYWLAISSLVETSRRPVIMTCNDINLIPFNELPRSTVLDFSTPSPEICIPYLAIIGLNEGHLLDVDELHELLKLTKNDIRRAINELQFACQFQKTALDIGNVNGYAMNVTRLVFESRSAEEGNILSNDNFIEIEKKCLRLDCSGLDMITPWQGIETMNIDRSLDCDRLKAISTYCDMTSFLDKYVLCGGISRRDRDCYVYRQSGDDELGYSIVPETLQSHEEFCIESQIINASVLGCKLGQVKMSSTLEQRQLRSESAAYIWLLENHIENFVDFSDFYSRLHVAIIDHAPYLRMMIATDEQRLSKKVSDIEAAGMQRVTRQRNHRRYIMMEPEQARNILNLGFEY